MTTVNTHKLKKKQAHSSFSVHIVRNRRTKRNQERAWASVRAAAFSAPHIAGCHLFALMCCFYPQHLECFHSAGMMTPAGMPNFDLRGARWEHSVHYLSCGSLSVRRAVRHTPLSRLHKLAFVYHLRGIACSCLFLSGRLGLRLMNSA